MALQDWPKIHIISDCPAVVETQVNALCDEYSPAAWHISVVDSGIVVTCILVHNRVVREQMIAQMHMQPGPPFQIVKPR
jgi:hypothetical protein